MGVAGTWKGESICTIKNSPCHDEQVVYHVSAPDRDGKLKIQADKIVNGKPEDMGTLDCTFDSKTSRLKCPIARAVFEFEVTETRMIGTLKLTDGTLYRNISLTKD
jgi:hypothetical protein